MKRPSFQFYPADWRNNAKLRRCSEAARGAWVDVLCVLHDSDEYGVCRWPLADLARSAGVSLKAIRELADKDVLKGSDKGASAYVYTPRHAGQDGEPVTLISASESPCWFSSRFVRDEYVRTKRGIGSRFDQDNQPPKQSPKPPIGDGNGMRHGDGPSSASSSSSPSLNTFARPAGADGANAELFPTQPRPSSVSPATELPQKPPRKPRPPDLVFDAIAEVCGMAGAVNDMNAGRIAVAKKNILQCTPAATPDEIRRRAANYRHIWPSMTLTPTALAKHWTQCERGTIEPVRVAH